MMSTRCTINFTDGVEVVAKIYRHSDGYPDSKHGVPASLRRFFVDVESQTNDTRFTDPSYLAAKFVVWQAKQFARGAPLAFLSLGICIEDPGDIAYTYRVNTSALDDLNRPLVTAHRPDGCEIDIPAEHHPNTFAVDASFLGE